MNREFNRNKDLWFQISQGQESKGECCSKGTFIKAAKKILEERHLRGQISGPIKAKPALINTKNFAVCFRIVIDQRSCLVGVVSPSLPLHMLVFE